jgi:hypothetical protein
MTGKRHNYSFTITGKNNPENNSEKQKQEEQEKNNENGKNQEANQEEKAQETNKDSSENKDKTTDKTTVKKSISKAQIIGIKDKTYTGKAISQNLTVKLGGTKLKAGTDYTVKYKNNKNAGKATITITGKGKYKGTATARFKIKKAANSLNVKAKKKTYFFTYSKLLKRDYKIKESLIYKISKKGQGSLSYTLSSAMTGKKNVKSRFAVDKKTGKITVKKKITKGNYKLTINVTAAGDKNHNKSTKKISVSVKVR